jgi:hypothetical protein
MDTTRKRMALVNRGDLIQAAGGFVIADTWSATPGSVDGKTVPVGFWFDTDGGRHFADATDGTLTVGAPGFRTRDYGKVPGGVGHILLNPVPGQPPAGYCPASRNLGDRMSVWSSGTALTGVTCTACRRMVKLVNAVRR